MTANASNSESDRSASEFAPDGLQPDQIDFVQAEAVRSEAVRSEPDQVNLDQVSLDQVNSYQAEIQALKAELSQTRLTHQMAIEMAQFQAGFLARTSHELRSPINSVIGLHQLILSDLCDNPAEEREFVAQAYSSAQKMLGLLDELIRVSQLVQNTARLRLEPVPLQEVLAAVEQATHLQAKNRNLQLEIQPPDPEVTVLTDERWLRQVLIQLIDMPLSVMQQGFVRLTVQVNQESQQAQIQIEDQRPADCWQDSLDQMASFDSKLGQASDKQTALQILDRLPPAPSIGLKLLTQRSLLELMGGQLVLLETPVLSGNAANSQLENATRIQCVLPLATNS